MSTDEPTNLPETVDIIEPSLLTPEWLFTPAVASVGSRGPGAPPVGASKVAGTALIPLPIKARANSPAPTEAAQHGRHTVHFLKSAALSTTRQPSR